MKSNKTILVTGSNGQLGKTIQKKSLKEKEFDWIFLPKENLNITKVIEINKALFKTSPGFKIGAFIISGIIAALYIVFW